MIILSSVGNNDLLAAILGYGAVVLGLAAAVLIVFAVVKYLTKKAPEAAPVQEEAVEEAPAELAPGSAGQVKLHSVPPKTAAMLMAIVADKMGKPLNELRFISIKEVR